MAPSHTRSAAEWRRRIYEVMEEGAIGDPVGNVLNKVHRHTHPRQSGGGRSAIGTGAGPYVRLLVRSDRVCFACGLHGRICAAALGRRRAPAASPPQRRVGAPEVRLERAGHRRSPRGAAVLVHPRAAVGAAQLHCLPHRASAQARAAIPERALAARSHPFRAPRAVRLSCHPSAD